MVPLGEKMHLFELEQEHVHTPFLLSWGHTFTVIIAVLDMTIPD